MKITLPIHQEIVYKKKNKKNKRFLVGLNRYRNAYHHESNNIKKQYHQMVKDKVWKKKFNERIYLKYEIYIKNRRTDYHNIRSIIEKFFLDWLVVNGNIKDDWYDYVWGDESEVFIDKDNPRIEIEIYS